MFKEFIDAMGGSKVAIVGNPMGSWIAAVLTLNNREKVTHPILVDSDELHCETYPPISLNPSTKEDKKYLLLAVYADPSRVTERMINDQWEYRRDIRATVRPPSIPWRPGRRFLTACSLISRSPRSSYGQNRTRLSHLHSPGSSPKAFPDQSRL
jgi:pimeloyl-ACP methyl ester carboxylesterase